MPMSELNWFHCIYKKVIPLIKCSCVNTITAFMWINSYYLIDDVVYNENYDYGVLSN